MLQALSDKKTRGTAPWMVGLEFQPRSFSCVALGRFFEPSEPQLSSCFLQNLAYKFQRRKQLGSHSHSLVHS